MAEAAYTGVFPIAPTPFTAAQDLDLDGQRRVLDCMIDQGVDGICVLANYSEQFLLTDAERTTLLDLCLSHVAGRVPVIVTCSHYSTRVAAERRELVVDHFLAHRLQLHGVRHREPRGLFLEYDLRLHVEIRALLLVG